MLGFAQNPDGGLDYITDDVTGWRRMLPICFGLVLAFALGLLFLLAGRATVDRDAAIAAQRQSYETIVLARNAEGSAARAESLLARYVVSLDANDGRRYSDEWRQAGTMIANLRRATRHNLVQSRNMAQLQTTYEQRSAVLNDIALRTTYAQRLGALSRLYAANRARDADRIQEILEDAITHEMKVLNRRTEMVDKSEVRMARLSGSYILVGVLVLVAAFLALWFANSAFSERRFARRIAQTEAARVDDLEIAVRERTEQLVEANGLLRTEMEERAQAEESLRQLHKMEAIGQLTGGIAHDFNNMLAVILGGLELARRRMGDNAEAARHIDNAVEGTNRAASLTRQLLAFARAEPLLPTAMKADELVTGMTELIDRTIGDQIEVTVKAEAGDWRLWADRHQLENALLNLCVNARDAMEGRGKLTVSSALAVLKAGEINDCAAGDYVCLTVSDTGYGMTPDVLARVFEPFFTTKPVGKGTGLGLSQVFGYIGQCKGQIRILSAPGRGTDVEIYLPRHTGRADSEQVAAVFEGYAGAVARSAPQSIFVVEDDPRVLATTLTSLRELGHACESCEHPKSAATALAAYPQAQLILTDVMMPEMSGPEMVAGLRAQGVTLPVIFVTGFAGDDAETGMLDGEHVLRKPYTLAQLDRIIQEAVAQYGDGLTTTPANEDDGPDKVAFSA